LGPYDGGGGQGCGCAHAQKAATSENHLPEHKLSCRSPRRAGARKAGHYTRRARSGDVPRSPRQGEKLRCRSPS
jgi:hypothetical protein